MASLQPIFVKIFEVKIGGRICYLMHPPLLKFFIFYKFVDILAYLPFMPFEYHLSSSVLIAHPTYKRKSKIFKLFVKRKFWLIYKKGEVKYQYHCTLHLAIYLLLWLVIGSSFITVPKGTCYSLTVSSLNAKLSRHTFTINPIYLELHWLIILNFHRKI